MPNQRWLPVPGWPYEAGSRGRVRSPRGTLKPTPDKDGYLYVELSDGTRRRYVHVARLVLEAHVGPPGPGQEALHGNGRRRDDRLANLRWGTREENIADRERHRAQREGRSGTSVTDGEDGASRSETDVAPADPMETGTGVSP